LSKESYKVIKTDSYTKKFSKLLPEVQKRIEDKINNELVHDPHSFPFLQGKYKNARKLRVGEYRVLFVIDEKNKSIILYEIIKREKGYLK
jgi:mRNA-degrading endonuclease RelE of RelBE toxin-antitoxin system